MARRVNKKFVMALSITLGGIAVVATLGVTVLRGRIRNFFRPHDPAVYVKQAQDAENHDDLFNAANLYIQAAELAVQEHKDGADTFYAKSGDLFMKLSDKATDSQSAAQYYHDALQQWQQALLQNALNRDLYLRLIDNLYSEADTYPGAQNWSALEKQCAKLMELDKDHTLPVRVYLDHAEAALRQIQHLNLVDLPQDRIDGVEKEIDAILAGDQDNDQAMSLKGEVAWLDANVILARGAPIDAEAQYQDAMALLSDDKDGDGFLKSHPNAPEVARIFAGELFSRFLLREAARIHAIEVASGVAGANVNIEAVKNLEKEANDYRQHCWTVLDAAYAAHPDDKKLLALVYRTESRGRAANCEQMLKTYSAAHPDDPDGPSWLGLLYHDLNRPRDEIAAYADAITKTKFGGGLLAPNNELLDAQDMYHIASAYLDLVEAEGADTTQGKQDLDAGLAAADRLRRSHTDPAYQELLDGRAQYLQGNIATSMSTLAQAEANIAKLNSDAKSTELAVRAKLLLARANVNAGQRGKAIQYLDAAIAMVGRTGNENLIVERANLLIAGGEYDKAKTSLESLGPDIPEPGRTIAVLLRAQIRVASNDFAGARKILDASSAPGAIFRKADLDYLHGESGKAATDEQKKAARAQLAIDDLHILFKDKDGNPVVPDLVEASVLMAQAELDLGNAADANRFLDAALKKFPNNSGLQMARVQETSPDEDPFEQRKKMIDAITDEFTKNLDFGDLYYTNHQVDKAIESLKKAEAAIANPDSTDGRVKLGKVTDKLFNAYFMQAAAEKDPAKQNALWDTVQTYAQRAERLDLDGVKGKLYEGRLEYERSGGKEGLKLIEEAVALRPDYSLARSILGGIYLQKQQNDAALEEFRQAIALTPSDQQALQGALQILTARLDPDSKSEAGKLAAQALGYYPRTAIFQAYADQVGDLAESITRRKALLARDPNNLDNIYQLAILYLRQSDESTKPDEAQGIRGRAIAVLQPAFDKNKENLTIASLLAHLYILNAKPEVAVSLFDALAKVADPAARCKAILARGRICIEANFPQQAEASFKEALALQPDGSDVAQRALAQFYFQTGDFKQANEQYQALLAMNKDGEPRLLIIRKLAEIMMIQKNYQQGRDYLDAEILNKQPDDQPALLLRAISYLNQDKPDSQKAIDDLNFVLNKNPNYADALYYRALADVQMATADAAIDPLKQQRTLDDAEADLKKILSIDASNLKVRVKLAAINRLRREYAIAADEYEEAIKTHPESLATRVEYDQYLMEIDAILVQPLPSRSDDTLRNIRQVLPEERLNRLINGTAGFGRTPAEQEQFANAAHRMWADFLNLRGNTKEAQAQYKWLLTKPNFQNDRAIIVPYLKTLLDTENYQQVVDVASDNVLRQPDCYDYFILRAAAYKGLKKPADALNDVERAFGAAPRDLDVFMALITKACTIVPPDDVIDRLKSRYAASPQDYISGISLAFAYFKANRSAEAIEVASKLQPPADDVPTKCLILKLLGTACIQSGDYQNAVDDYKKVIAQIPDDIGSLNNIAYILADRLNRARDAESYANTAVRLLNNTPNVQIAFASNGTVYDTYGWVLYLNGNTDESITAFHKALETSTDPMTYFHLATAYKKRGGSADRSSAVDICNKGIELAKTANDQEAYTKLLALRDELPR